MPNGPSVIPGARLPRDELLLLKSLPRVAQIKASKGLAPNPLPTYVTRVLGSLAPNLKNRNAEEPRLLKFLPEIQLSLEILK